MHHAHPCSDGQRLDAAMAPLGRHDAYLRADGRRPDDAMVDRRCHAERSAVVTGAGSFVDVCTERWPGFRATGMLLPARKSEVLPGELDGMQVVAKRLLRPNAVWQW